MFGLVTTFAALLAASATSMVASAPAASSLHLRNGLEDTLSRQEAKRLVINPHITYPDESAVWHTGQKGVNATWDVPPNAEGYKGRLLLGYLLKNDTSGNEHLFLDPLADGFNLTDGRVSFDIPCNNEIKSRNTYIVVLMGDSGNKSGNFTIHREIDHCPNLKPKKPKTAGASGGSNSTALPASTSAAGASTGATTTVAGGAPAQSPAPVQEEAPATDDTSSDSTEQA